MRYQVFDSGKQVLSQEQNNSDQTLARITPRCMCLRDMKSRSRCVRRMKRIEGMSGASTPLAFAAVPSDSSQGYGLENGLLRVLSVDCREFAHGHRLTEV
jgi:hypothetical protein